jgi:hypothetical protein
VIGGTEGVRQPIETVPKDGNAVILEDHVSGSYELAHWSAQDSAWVKENGGHCEIAPTYWHAINSAKHLEEKENFEPASQTGSGFPASPDIAPLQMIACSDAPSVTVLDEEIARAADEVPKKRRIATWCGVAMVVASLTCMYFRADFAAYVARHTDHIGETTDRQIPTLTTAHPRAVNVVSDDTAPQAQTVGVNLPARITQVAPVAPSQSSDNYERTKALEEELRASREALAEAQESKLRSMQAAQDASSALQQSLDKIAILETKLELAHRHIEQGVPSPQRPGRISRRKAGSISQPGFFGLFNSASNRTAHRPSARIR